jgi:hypothetical protein
MVVRRRSGRLWSIILLGAYQIIRGTTGAGEVRHYSRTCWKAGGGISVEWLSYLERVNVGLEFHRHLLQVSHGEMLT